MCVVRRTVDWWQLIMNRYRSSGKEGWKWECLERDEEGSLSGKSKMVQNKKLKIQ